MNFYLYLKFLLLESNLYYYFLKEKDTIIIKQILV